MKVFLSYGFKPEQTVKFVRSVCDQLRRTRLFEVFFWEDSSDATQEFPAQLAAALADSAIVVFLGEQCGETQLNEVLGHQNRVVGKPRIRVELTKKPESRLDYMTSAWAPVVVEHLDGEGPKKCAQEIIAMLERCGARRSAPPDGLPDGYPFDYEKHIVEEYVTNGRKASAKYVEMGCPADWPDVVKDEFSIDHRQEQLRNPVGEDVIGDYRGKQDRVIVDTRHGRGDGLELLTLPEAGPREFHRYPLPGSNELVVGILVSGGIAPGINAVIDGIVARHHLYHKRGSHAPARSNRSLKILGYTKGFHSLLDREGKCYEELEEGNVHGKSELGGSMLGTSRADDLVPGLIADRLARLNLAVERLVNDGVQILYVIGGDGSMRAAHAIWNIARQRDHREHKLSVIGIPKTTDNDILWVWQSFGFLSAVEKAREVILNIHTEVTSNPRVGIIQLFGSDSGFVVSHAAYSALCDLVLIPEDPLTMDQIFEHLKARLRERLQKGRPYGLVVMAETAIPADADKHLDNENVNLTRKEREAVEKFLGEKRRVRGQTPDELRSAGLKIVSRVLEEKIRALPERYWNGFRVFTNEPRHLIRSIRPSVSDVIFGERLGTLAVDNAMAGYTDFMVSQWVTEFVLVPLSLVVLGRKRVPRGGIFWKSVLAKTGQPSGAA